MSRGINKLILIGNLGQDLELKYTPKGNAYAQISLVTHREYKTAEGELRKETTWHRATVWGKRAEVCARYLRKGSRIYLEGELVFKDWTDKDGIARKSAEILVEDIRFLADSPRPSESPSPEEALVAMGP